MKLCSKRESVSIFFRAFYRIVFSWKTSGRLLLRIKISTYVTKINKHKKNTIHASCSSAKYSQNVEGFQKLFWTNLKQKQIFLLLDFSDPWIVTILDYVRNALRDLVLLASDCNLAMVVFHVLKIAQMLPNRAIRLICSRDSTCSYWSYHHHMIKFNRAMVLLDFSRSMLYFAGKKGTLSEIFFLFHYQNKLHCTKNEVFH